MSERQPVTGDEPKGAPEEDPRIAGEKHPVARMIGIGVVASLVGIGLTLLIDWFPKNAAGSADKIDTLYDVLLICSVPIFVLVMTVAIYSVWRFRAKPGDMADGPPIHGNTRLEVVWVTIPFIMVTALAIYGWIVLDDLEARASDELVVQVTGQQFTWSFEYPQEKVESTQLVLPVDQPVEFRIRTNDVIHSFWVPEFRLKSDAVPGLTTRVRLTPTEEGSYQVVCAELCGIGHAAMRQLVRVVPRDEYDSWLESRRQAAGGGQGGGGGETGGGQGGGGQAGGAETGGGRAVDAEALFSSAGCGGCHTLAAAGTDADVGPDLGEISKADAAYIEESITDPSAVVVKGYPDGVMPDDFAERLSQEEIDALVKYLLEAQE